MTTYVFLQQIHILLIVCYPAKFFVNNEILRFSSLYVSGSYYSTVYKSSTVYKKDRQVKHYVE